VRRISHRAQPYDFWVGCLSCPEKKSGADPVAPRDLRNAGIEGNVAVAAGRGP